MGKLVLGINDFATVHPTLCQEWNSMRNGDLTPSMFSYGSKQKVWWTCAAHNHEYISTILAKSNGGGCPYCSNQKLLAGFNDLATTHPEIALELSAYKNSLTASEVFAGSEKKLWWQCKDFDHAYESVVKDKVGKNTGCPFCSGNRVLQGFNDIATTHPEFAIEFSSSRNMEITVNNIAIGSGRKVWWECLEYKHLYQASPTERKRGQGCVYCAGKKVLRGFNDFNTTHPSIAVEFNEDLNQGLSVHSISQGMTKLVWWKCPAYGHDYQSRVYNRTYGQGCPYCSGNKVLKGFNDLFTTHPALSKEFLILENAPLHPGVVSSGSHSKVWWKCQNSHVWKTAVKDRVMGNGCAQCSEAQTSKIQQAFHKELSKLIPDLQCDVRIPVKLRKRSSVAVDMLSESLKVAIEYDGRYYHSGGRSGQTMASHIANDTEKTQALLDAGYRVVRIRENGLPHLKMNTDKVFEIDYKYGASMDNSIAMMKQWIEQG